MIKVTQYLRKPGKQSHSIERLFEDIRSRMPADIEVTTCRNRFISKGLFRRMYDLFRATRYQGDVNHVTGDVHFITYLLRRDRTILTIHDFVPLERLKGIKKWIFWLLWHWLPEKRCAVITVVSEATKQQVFRHLKCDQSKVKVIHNNVSEEFRPVPKLFNSKKPRILQIGTNPNKNIPRLAEALAGLPCTLVIVGQLTPGQSEILQRFRIEYENYANLPREQLLDQYHRCDMLAFVSTYEGFGLPIVEANAVGRPVVTSNCWSMPEVGGDAAWYIDPFNVTSIREGVLRIISDAGLRARLVQNGYENVKRFNICTIADQYAKLYRKISNKNINLYKKDQDKNNNTF